MPTFTVTAEFLASLNNPAVAAVFDARLICETVLAGEYGDADPRALLAAAIESLQSARAAMGA